MKMNRVLGGVVVLGLAAGAHAAFCPPEECGAASPVEARVLLLTDPVQQGDGSHIWVHPVMETLAHADVARWQPEGKVRSRTITKSDKGEKGSYVIVNDKDTVTLTIENGKVVSLDRNGKKIPAEKIKKSGNKITIMGDSGETVYEVDLSEEAGATGQRWSAANASDFFPVGREGVPGVNVMKMEPPKAMIGVQLGDANGVLLGHFGLKPGEATLVTGVYEGLPAGKAGLKPYDLIVAVNGETPAGQTQVREALRGINAGEKVRMTVIQRGHRKDVELTLVEYSDEVLADSKLDAVDADAMAFSIGLGNGENVFLAPGVGQLRNFQDAERLREFAESWRAQAEEYAKGFAARPSDRLAAPMAPGAPVPPRAGAGSAATDERWQRMEERLERLEKMLERLAEQRRGVGGRSGGAGAGG